MNIALTDAIAATGARARDWPPGGPALHVVTDTRTIAAGDAFLALRGPSFDGHDFVADAFARGAHYAIVSDASVVPAGYPALVVDDTLRAYLDLAAHARGSLGMPVVAITGSTGKTTTKHLLAQLLRDAGVRVAATPENENNEIGVSKFFLARERGKDDVAIAEMGARHFGDIATLASVARPEISVLTNVGDAHVEIMGSRERLAQTKWAIFETGAQPVVNLSDAVSRERVQRLTRPPHWFGAGDAALAAARDVVRGAGTMTIVRDATNLTIADAGGTRTYAIDARLPGEHNRANLAAALAVAQTFVPITKLVPLIAGLTLPSGRYERIERGGATFVYDAYNASGSGTLASLRAFAEEPATRRIVVFGGMAELGDDAPALHASIGDAVAQLPFATLLAGGDLADATVAGAQRTGLAAAQIVRYADNREAATWLARNVRPGDTVLLKGSRRYRMEQIWDALAAAEVHA